MAPWGPGAITKIAWGKVYIPHCGIYHGEQGMNPNPNPETGKTTGENQPKSTVDQYTTRRITHALCADRIIEIKPVSENTYFVAYDYCENGWCYYVESYVIFQDGGRTIREKVIRMM